MSPSTYILRNSKTSLFKALINKNFSKNIFKALKQYDFKKNSTCEKSFIPLTSRAFGGACREATLEAT
jgi:hypothetical protein